jgi:hypothetical protein
MLEGLQAELPILVCFFDRKKRDEILRKRRNLKNKGIVIDEDLTIMNYKLLQKALSVTGSVECQRQNSRQTKERPHSYASYQNTNTKTYLSFLAT